jgi:hypothetical protein
MTHPAGQISGKWHVARKQAVGISPEKTAKRNRLMLSRLISFYLCQIKELIFYFIVWQLFIDLIKIRLQGDVAERYKIAGGMSRYPS